MEAKQLTDIEENTLKLILLNEEISPCVCCRLYGKSAIEGWQPKGEQKNSKKRVDTSRGGNQGLLRRERTILTASKGNFLFRHYDSLDRYIKQYRENHASTCMERYSQDGGGLVLGVDLPDPYLPKIASSSVLIERIKIIEALSSYYSTERDVKNICLTGRKAEAKCKDLPVETNKSDNVLPQIEQNSSKYNNNNNSNNNTDIQIHLSLPTVNETDDEFTASENNTPKTAGKEIVSTFSERLRRHQDVRDIIRVTSSASNRQKDIKNFKNKKESIILPAAKLVCNNVTGKSQNPENHTFKELFPQIPLGTEYDPLKHNKKPERVLEKLRIGKKVRLSEENSTEELCDEILNLRSLETRDGINSRGGNLCLGKTMRPGITPRDQQKKNKSRKFPKDSALRQLSRTVKNSPREATFIKILGQQKGPIPVVKETNMAPAKHEQSEVEDKIKPSARKDYGIHLSYLRRFGRRSFHHVLEARSYKPETRELGTTVIPN